MVPFTSFIELATDFLTMAQSTVSLSSVSRRRLTFFQSTGSTNLINNRTLLISSTVRVIAESCMNCFSNSWRSADVFLPLLRLSTHSISSLFDSQSQSLKPYLSKSHSSNFGQLQHSKCISSTSAWMLGVTTRGNAENRLLSGMSLISISAVKVSR